MLQNPEKWLFSSYAAGGYSGQYETLANRYSSEGTQRELLNYYQHDMVQIVFKDLNCVLGLWAREASALEE